jgi:hypothetical protein
LSVADEIKKAIMKRRKFMDGTGDKKSSDNSSVLKMPTEAVVEEPKLPKLPEMEGRISMMIPPPPIDDANDDDSENSDWGD